MFLWSKAFVDLATPNKNVKVTILDEIKRRIDLQVKLERLDAFSKTTNDLTKQERARKMLTKVNVTYDRDTMFVITLEIAKKMINLLFNPLNVSAFLM